MNVAYQGPLKDYSGYGEANRHAVAALDAAGVGVRAMPVNYTMEPSDMGAIGELVSKLEANRAPYAIKILHTTPDEYKRFLEPGKYHIGHFFWETSRVPKDFIEGLNSMDEIWTGSKANRDAILSTGVEKPVYIFPQALDTSRGIVEPYEITDFTGYLFYSIFEWTDRKNPEALIRAYFEEFQNDENVGLLIKTYFRNFTLQNKRMIRNAIARIKSEMGLAKYPPVFLYLDLMDRSQIWRLHSTGHCFVSAHRGEGWGVPQVEAALAGRPVISTGYGGCHEYLTDGDTAVVLPYKMASLKGMKHSSHWYTPDQKWAEVDAATLRGGLRWAYSKSESAAEMGERGRQFVIDRFNLERVGKEMAERLDQITKGLSGQLGKGIITPPESEKRVTEALKRPFLEES